MATWRATKKVMIKPEVFDDFALDYDKWFENHEIEYAQELKAIRAFLPKEGNGVEIGAGTGRFSQPLGISLGIEPSQAMRNIGIHRGVDTGIGTAETPSVKDGV